MDLKRTCICAAAVTALCFTVPLGMQIYSAHSKRINTIAAVCADLTVGEYPAAETSSETSEPPDENPAAAENSVVTVSRKTVWDIDMAPEETQPVIQSRQLPSAQPSQEILDKIKYPESLENHDGVIQEYTYPHYTGTQYIDLKAGGQVRNCTDVPNSTLVAESTKDLPFVLDKNSDQPQVLIYHTHTTESFEPYERD
ncbi:MAG: stage II sporulation protein P, partial [Ruminococcus sp.]|nr:stage II sporulation protein P [Ruminococcus sp.]